MVAAPALVAASVLLAVSAAAEQDASTDPGGASGRVTLSIVGTTDLHGRVFPDDAGRGGLALLGGYLRNLRAAREADGGAVLLLDAGDTFESGIASNISEGALVVDAYNALGYDALAIGNHEFDYGAVDTASADSATPDRPDSCAPTAPTGSRAPAWNWVSGSSTDARSFATSPARFRFSSRPATQTSGRAAMRSDGRTRTAAACPKIRGGRQSSSSWPAKAGIAGGVRSVGLSPAWTGQGAPPRPGAGGGPLRGGPAIAATCRGLHAAGARL